LVLKANKILGEVSCNSDDISSWRGNRLILTIQSQSETQECFAQGLMEIRLLDPLTFSSEPLCSFFQTCPATQRPFSKIERSFHFTDLKGKLLRIKEVLYESPFLFVVVKMYLRLLTEEEKAIIREYDSYSFIDPYLQNLKAQQLAFHLELAQHFQFLLG